MTAAVGLQEAADGAAAVLGFSALVGQTVIVYWPVERCWFYGKVKAHDAAAHSMQVHYEDGEVHWNDTCQGPGPGLRPSTKVKPPHIVPQQPLVKAPSKGERKRPIDELAQPSAVEAPAVDSQSRAERAAARAAHVAEATHGETGRGETEGGAGAEETGAAAPAEEAAVHAVRCRSSSLAEREVAAVCFPTAPPAWAPRAMTQTALHPVHGRLTRQPPRLSRRPLGCFAARLRRARRLRCAIVLGCAGSRIARKPLALWQAVAAIEEEQPVRRVSRRLSDE